MAQLRRLRSTHVLGRAEKRARAWEPADVSIEGIENCRQFAENQLLVLTKKRTQLIIDAIKRQAQLQRCR